MSHDVATSADLTSCIGAPDRSRTCRWRVVTRALRCDNRTTLSRTSLMRARLLESRAQAASAGVRSLA